MKKIIHAIKISISVILSSCFFLSPVNRHRKGSCYNIYLFCHILCKYSASLITFLFSNSLHISSASFIEHLSALYPPVKINLDNSYMRFSLLNSLTCLFVIFTSFLRLTATGRMNDLFIIFCCFFCKSIEFKEPI